MAGGVVEFTGRVTGEEVYRRLGETDVFVYPTPYRCFRISDSRGHDEWGTVPVVTLLEGITDSIVR